MFSARVMSLGLLAAALVAAPAYLVVAQPTGNPAPAGNAQPDGGRGQPGPGGPGGPGGEGRRGPGGRGGEGGRGMEGGGSIKQSMSTMNRAMRNMKTTVGDSSKKEENLKLVNDIQRGCVGAKGISPDKVMNKEKDDAKKAGIAVSYRKSLITILEKSIALEKAIMDDNSADAKKIYAEIDELRERAHTEMGVRE